MKRVQRIVLPTDFSTYAAEATQYACAVADKYSAELHVLHVIQDISSQLPDFGMGLAAVGVRGNFEEHRDQLEQAAIGELAKVLPDGWEQGKHVVLGTRFGKASVEIVKYAQEHAADLIILGTHGRSGLMHALMGSVAENVVRTAECPVLTVRIGERSFVPTAAAESGARPPQKPKTVIRHAIESLYGICPHGDFPAANDWANTVDWERVKETVDSDHPGFQWREKGLDESAAAEKIILDLRAEMLHAAGSTE